MLNRSLGSSELFDGLLPDNVVIILISPFLDLRGNFINAFRDWSITTKSTRRNSQNESDGAIS